MVEIIICSSGSPSKGTNVCTTDSCSLEYHGSSHVCTIFTRLHVWSWLSTGYIVTYVSPLQRLGDIDHTHLLSKTQASLRAWTGINNENGATISNENERIRRAAQLLCVCQGKCSLLLNHTSHHFSRDNWMWYVRCGITSIDFEDATNSLWIFWLWLSRAPWSDVQRHGHSACCGSHANDKHFGRWESVASSSLYRVGGWSVRFVECGKKQENVATQQIELQSYLIIIKICFDLRSASKKIISKINISTYSAYSMHMHNFN